MKTTIKNHQPKLQWSSFQVKTRNSRILCWIWLWVFCFSNFDQNWWKSFERIALLILLIPFKAGFIVYLSISLSGLGVIIVAYHSISGHTHNSLSCNLVIKQLTFLNFVQTVSMDINILVTGESRVGKSELIDSFRRSSNGVSFRFFGTLFYNNVFPGWSYV